MKNAIVYSFHVKEPTLSDNYSFEQLKLSLKTLREFNPDIPVIVYISPSTIIDRNVLPMIASGVTIERFNASTDPRLEHQTYNLWTSHKWKNAFNALEKHNLDNVLYIDTDTIIRKNLDYVFDKYGNTDYVWGTPDISDKWTKVFNVKNGGMNDGQFILSKHTLPYKDGILKERVDYVLRLQEQFKDHPDAEVRITGVQWVACQYAVSEYLHSIGKPLQFFGDDFYIVHKLDEFKQISNAQMDRIAVVHYLNYHMFLFCPEAYQVYKKTR